MKIEIDVPDTTKAISVCAIIGAADGNKISVTSRCFTIVDGKAEDETGSNKVLSGGKDNA